MNLKRPDLNSGMLRPMIALEKHKKMTQKNTRKKFGCSSPFDGRTRLNHPEIAVRSSNERRSDKNKITRLQNRKKSYDVRKIFKCARMNDVGESKQ